MTLSQSKYKVIYAVKSVMLFTSCTLFIGTYDKTYIVAPYIDKLFILNEMPLFTFSVNYIELIHKHFKL